MKLIGLQGLTASVALTVMVPAGLGLSCSLTSSSVTLSSSKTSGSSVLSCADSVAGTYQVVVNGTIGNVSHQSTITFIIQDFKVSSNPVQISIVSGAMATATIKVSSLNGFSGNVSLAASTIGGFYVSLSPSYVLVPSGTDASITLTAWTSGVSPASYLVTVTATFAFNSTVMLSEQVGVTLVVTPPPVIRVPGSQVVTAGSTLKFAVNVTDADLSRTVFLSGSGLPNGAVFETSEGTGAFTGIFSWAPTDVQAGRDYNVTFTASDHDGGIVTGQVTIHVAGRSQSAPLMSFSQYLILALSAFALAVMAPVLVRVLRGSKRSLGGGTGFVTDSEDS